MKKLLLCLIPLSIALLASCGANDASSSKTKSKASTVSTSVQVEESSSMSISASSTAASTSKAVGVTIESNGDIGGDYSWGEISWQN